MLKITQLSKGTEIHVSIYNHDNWYVPASDYWANREANNTRINPTVLSMNETISLLQGRNLGAHKIMCMGPENEIEVMYQALTSLYGNDLHVYRSKSTYIEIADKKISKKSAIQTLLDHTFSTINWQDIIAFGDNFNDMEMLTAVGMGVAVQNSKPEVLAIADDTTLSNKEHGVALSIEKHFQ